MNQTPLKAATVFLRLALAGAFLSAIADRFGLWGKPGDPNVAWGNWDAFVEYTAYLNWFVPESIAPVLAWTATILEASIAIGLIVGFRLQHTALASGILLTLFALTMIFAIGIKAPFDYSVLTAAGGSFLLAAISPQTPFSKNNS
jgi:uncharacterized membrane protein YphA (DoxX/SURF4 family)